MTRVYVGIGSNIDRDYHIRNSIAELRGHFGELDISSVYESEAYGFDGDNFYNLVVGFDTDKPLSEVASLLKEIEARHGRKQQEQSFLSRTLDLDLLLFGDKVIHGDGYDLPREDITRYAFTLCPLAEIAGEEKHPELGKTYSDLWKSFADSEQELWPVEFDFRL